MRVCRSLWTSAFVLAVLASSASVDAQSLGDMAQRSAERAQQKAARTYTNDDLPAPAPTTVAATSVAAEPVAAPAPAPPADTAAADTATPPAGDSTRRPRIIENPAAGTANVVWEAPANKPDEAQWRSLIGGLRARISKTVADITAAEAEGVGLVNKVVPSPDLEKTTMELATRLAQSPTKSIGLIKRTLNKALASDLDTLLDYEATIQEIASLSEDHKEGVAAFLEKRQAQFKGK